jgi:hypothetical protein
VSQARKGDSGDARVHQAVYGHDATTWSRPARRDPFFLSFSLFAANSQWYRDVYFPRFTVLGFWRYLIWVIHRSRLLSCWSRNGECSLQGGGEQIRIWNPNRESRLHGIWSDSFLIILRNILVCIPKFRNISWFFAFVKPLRAINLRVW